MQKGIQKVMDSLRKAKIQTSLGMTALKTSLKESSSRMSNGELQRKPLILLLHGFTASMDTWEPLMKTLTEKGDCGRFDWLLMDFYGSGISSFIDSEYSTQVFEDQVNELLAALYLGTSFESSNSVDLEKLALRMPDMLIVGHSQGGIFAANYASNNSHSWVKGCMLITPGGISFDPVNDLYNHPMHIVPRTLYTAGASKWTQRLAINSSYGMLSYGSYIFQGISRTTGISFKDTLDYIHGFDVIRLEGREREQYLSMIASMLDHSDLLRDKSETYQKLGGRRIPLTLVLGEKDAIVPLTAGKRLRDTLISSQMHPSTIEEVVMDAGHTLPLELPDELLRVLLNVADRAFFSNVSVTPTQSTPTNPLGIPVSPITPELNNEDLIIH